MAMPGTTGAITAGLQTRDATAVEFGRSERTIQRWERMGLPVIRVGTVRMHDPAAVRDWLRSQQQRQDVPRRGRGKQAG